MRTKRRKNEYQRFKARMLRRPEVRGAFEEGLDDLRVAVRLAESRKARKRG